MKSDLPERTFAFAERIVRLCVFLEQNGRVSTTLATELLRSGTSVGANVEEAGSAESRRDFIHKYAIACKEARESHYWLRLLAASELITKERLDPLVTEANELIAILTTIIKKSRVLTFKLRTSHFKLPPLPLVCFCSLLRYKIRTRIVGSRNRWKGFSNEA